MGLFFARIVLAAALAPSLGASGVVWQTVARGAAQGANATTLASAKVNAPLGMRIVVVTKGSGASVDWITTCSKGLKTASKSGRFSVATGSHAHVLPLIYKSPDQCVASVDGELAGTGKILLRIQKKLT